MSNNATSLLSFDTSTALALEAAFDGGSLSADGGLPWLALVDDQIGICQSLAECVPEWRRGTVTHSIEDLVRQRVLQIACGYEDQNDAIFLRSDPLFKLACGRLPHTDADLASQPTLCRLDNAPDSRACYRIGEALVEIYFSQRPMRSVGNTPPRKVLLDFDSTDDPAHGEQEGVAYHGYFGQHQYHPLLVFDGDTGQFVTAVLRPGNVHASTGALAILKRLVGKIRQRWPQTQIEIRADAGFAIPAIYEYCEEEGIHYTIGFSSNSRLEEVSERLGLVAKLTSLLKARLGEHPKVRFFSEAIYEAGSWDKKKRRVIYKVEVLEKGLNIRYVVTNRSEQPQALYDEHYVKRGETENRIKDYKCGLRADRLSCCEFWANQFRLLLHAAAYWLLDELRDRVARAGYKRLQLATLRLRIVKIGGRVRQMVDKVRLHLATGHPGRRLWQALCSLGMEGVRE